MQLKNLKIYCDIVRLGSFSKAAELNGVSQPSVSQSVHSLEERLGVQLLDRSRRPFVVTLQGTAYFEGCRDLVQRYEQLEEQIRAMRAEPSVRLTVAAIYSVGLGQMHRLVGEYRSARPEVDLRVAYMHPDQVYKVVTEGEADLGIVSYPRSTNQLQSHPWREETYAVAVSPDHWLAACVGASASDLAKEPLVMPSRGLRMRDEVNRFFAALTNGPHVAAEFDNVESIKRAVEVDDGIALLPEPTFANERATGTLLGVRLTGEKGEAAPLVRPLGIVTRREHGLSDAGTGFFELLQQHADEPPDALPRRADPKLISGRATA